MANKAMAILRQKGILLRVAKSRAQEHIKPASIVAAKLAFVEFSCGSGKYENGKARLRWPQHLPIHIPPPQVEIPGLTWWHVVAVTLLTT